MNPDWKQTCPIQKQVLLLSTVSSSSLWYHYIYQGMLLLSTRVLRLSLIAKVCTYLRCFVHQKYSRISYPHLWYATYIHSHIYVSIYPHIFLLFCIVWTSSWMSLMHYSLVTFYLSSMAARYSLWMARACSCVPLHHKSYILAVWQATEDHTR